MKDLPVLQCGHCEPLKLAVHASALGLAVLCGIYNAAAWLSRREPHLAVNAVLYMALTIWEEQHVVHHIAEMKKPGREAPDEVAPPAVAVSLPPATTELAA
jgi:hypothetical protein